MEKGGLERFGVTQPLSDIRVRVRNLWISAKLAEVSLSNLVHNIPAIQHRLSRGSGAFVPAPARLHYATAEAKAVYNLSGPVFETSISLLPVNYDNFNFHRNAEVLLHIFITISNTYGDRERLWVYAPCGYWPACIGFLKSETVVPKSLQMISNLAFPSTQLDLGILWQYSVTMAFSTL